MWYEALNLKSNPFDDIGWEAELIGYDDIIEEIFYRIASGSIVYIEGRDGLGKSALLKRAISQFKGMGKIVYLNGNIVKDINIEEVLVNSNGFFGKLLKRMPDGIILLLDDVNYLSKKNCERLKYFYDQNYVKSIVFTGDSFEKANFTESLKERVSKVIRLNGINEEDVLELVESRIGDREIFDNPELVKEVWQKSERNFKRFFKNCERLCQHAIEYNGGKITKKEIMDILGKEADNGNKESHTKKVEVIEQYKKEIKKIKENIEARETKSEIELGLPMKSGKKEVELKSVEDRKEPHELVYEDVAEKYY